MLAMILNQMIVDEPQTEPLVWVLLIALLINVLLMQGKMLP
jgi:hypothetical protein